MAFYQPENRGSKRSWRMMKQKFFGTSDTPDITITGKKGTEFGSLTLQSQDPEEYPC